MTISLSTHAQTIKVLTTGAFKPIVAAIVSNYENRTGVKVEVWNDTAGALIKRIDAGELFDVVVLTPAALKKLTDDGRIASNRVEILAKVAIGVAVRKGSLLPNIDTPESFKATVMSAKKVAYIDPLSGGSSGIYLDGLFKQMGIDETVRKKAVLVKGGLVALKLESGEADLAIHQISEIMPVSGAQLVGPLPEAIQNYTVYAGGVSATSKALASADAFLTELSGPDAARILGEKGMLAVR
ncbi:MAG: ABC-type molybdate transport system periplasmic component [Polaromonas sp.]|nr:ABC-type molybdate transport system periplasmic component [Polaromonas sp.]